METEEKKDTDLFFMVLAALLGISIIAYVYYLNTKTPTKTNGSTTTTPSTTTTTTPSTTTTTTPSTTTTTTTATPANPSGSGTSTTIPLTKPSTPTTADFLSYPVGIPAFSYGSGLTNGAIAITITENFKQNLPNWTVYASLNPQFNPYVQLGNIPINTIYWNGNGQTGGQADNLSCYVPIYPINQFIDTPLTVTVYIVVVDTVNQVRSSVGTISLAKSWE
ncbi:MAG: hypothetical protein ACP5MB_06360 [bacterium]